MKVTVVRIKFMNDRKTLSEDELERIRRTMTFNGVKVKEIKYLGNDPIVPTKKYYEIVFEEGEIDVCSKSVTLNADALIISKYDCNAHKFAKKYVSKRFGKKLITEDKTILCKEVKS